jgi:thiamine pyrophosphokinase
MNNLNVITGPAIVLNNDPVLAVDAGLAFALSKQMMIVLAVGDFDTLPVPQNYHGPLVQFPSEKDQSDLELALNLVPPAYDNVTVYGALGRRMDHTLVNLKLLYYRDYHFRLLLVDEWNQVEVFHEGTYQLVISPFKYLSLLTFESCRISVSGVLYPLVDYCLMANDTLPLSNQAVDQVVLTVHQGRVLVMKGRDYATTTSVT